jgi:hypothetical protein
LQYLAPAVALHRDEFVLLDIYPTEEHSQHLDLVGILAYIIYE